MVFFIAINIILSNLTDNFQSQKSCIIRKVGFGARAYNFWYNMEMAVSSKEQHMSGETLGVKTEALTPRRRKRDAVGRFAKTIIGKARARSHSVAVLAENVDNEVVVSQSFVTFLQFDRLLEDSINSMGTDIGRNSRRDWISGDFSKPRILEELKDARIALRDIAAGKTKAELIDGRDDDLGHLIYFLGVKGGKKEFPKSKREMEKELLAINQEIQNASSKGFSGRGETEELSSRRRALVVQLTLLDIPNRDYVEVEVIKGAETNIEGVSANVAHYKFAGVSRSRVTIMLDEAMREKVKNDLQNLPPLEVIKG